MYKGSNKVVVVVVVVKVRLIFCKRKETSARASWIYSVLLNCETFSTLLQSVKTST